MTRCDRPKFAGVADTIFVQCNILIKIQKGFILFAIKKNPGLYMTQLIAIY